MNLEEYKNYGFTLVKGFFNKNEIAIIEEELSRFIESSSKDLRREEINYTPDGKINSIHKIAGKDAKTVNYFTSLLMEGKVFDLATFFLEDKADPRKVEFFAKPAKTGMKSPWHQDNYYWGVKDGNALTIWIALDRTSIQNGAVKYLKGSHKLGVLEHKDSFAPGSSQMIADEDYIKTHHSDIFCPELNPGDCLVHSSLVVHGSDDNHSGENRRGLTFQYKGMSSEYDQEMIRYYMDRLKKQVDARESSKK